MKIWQFHEELKKRVLDRCSREKLRPSMFSITIEVTHYTDCYETGEPVVKYQIYDRDGAEGQRCIEAMSPSKALALWDAYNMPDVPTPVRLVDSDLD